MHDTSQPSRVHSAVPSTPPPRRGALTQGAVTAHRVSDPTESPTEQHGTPETDGVVSGGTRPIDGITSDAQQVHAQLRSLQSCGNEIRLAVLDSLRMLYDRGLCFELGYASYQQYCDRELGLPRSTAYEYLRAATALDGLPQLRQLFREGEMSWAQVRAISRVATAETEGQWIELAWTAPMRDLLAEVREAQRTHQSAPRTSRHGLPNLLVDLGIRVTLEEKERIRTAFALVGDALDMANGDFNTESTDQRPPLVRWADAVLAGLIPVGAQAADRSRSGSAPGGSRESSGENGHGDLRPTPAQTIVYHACPECRRSSVGTEDGQISVTPDRIAELAPHSHVEVAVDDESPIEVLPPGATDAPNTARLSRQVLHRDGLKCANPACGRRHELHAHHIIFRSYGGRTVLSNEVAVCSTCHAMIHDGLLDVSGSLDTGLNWTPRPLDPGVQVRDTEALRAKVNGLIGDTIASDASRVHGGPMNTPPAQSPRETSNSHDIEREPAENCVSSCQAEPNRDVNAP